MGVGWGLRGKSELWDYGEPCTQARVLSSLFLNPRRPVRDQSRLERSVFVETRARMHVFFICLFELDKHIVQKQEDRFVLEIHL